ncbi:MAG: MoaD/ThiS family protein [Promethearchaeota archaeon]
MQIKVEFLSYLAKFMGGRFITIEVGKGTTVGTLLAKLVEEYPVKFESNFLNVDGTLKGSVVLLINGKNLKQYADEFPDPMGVTLDETDEIAFIVPFGGG